MKFKNWLHINESVSSFIIGQAVNFLDNKSANPGLPPDALGKLKKFLKEIAKRWDETDHSIKAQAVIYLGAAAAAGITIPLVVSYLNKAAKKTPSSALANLASKVATYVTEMNLDQGGFAVIEKVKPFDLIKSGIESSRHVSGAEDSMFKFQKDISSIAKTGKGYEDVGLELYRDLMDAPTADILIVPDNKIDNYKNKNTLAFCAPSEGRKRSVIVMRRSLYSRLPDPKVPGDMGELTPEGKNVMAHEARHACQRSGKKTSHLSSEDSRYRYMQNPNEMGVRLAAIKALNEPYWFRMALKKTVPDDLLTGKVGVAQVPYMSKGEEKRGKIDRKNLMKIFNRFLLLDEKERFKLIMDVEEFYKELGKLLEGYYYFEDVNRRSFLKTAAAAAGLAGMAGTLKAQDRMDVMPANPLDIVHGLIHYMLYKANYDAYDIIEYYEGLDGKDKRKFMQELIDNYDKVVAAPSDKKDLA